MAVEKLREMADRLRGKAMSDAQAVGKQLSQQVGQAQTVKEIGGPAATPKLAQDQSGPARQRHVTEKQAQNQIGSPAGGAPEQKPVQSAPEKSVGAAGKDKSLAEVAQQLRQAGVSSGRAANDVAPAKQTPAVDHKQSRGRGR
jgi:hypothetical protein